MTVSWLEKQNCQLCKNLEVMRQHLSFFEDWRDFGNQQKFVKFLKLRAVLILRYLLTDLLLTQIKFVLV